MQVQASPTPSASIQDEISRESAPAACAAVKTSAAELVTPTMTAISPATTAEGGAIERMRVIANMSEPLPLRCA